MSSQAHYRGTVCAIGSHGGYKPWVAGEACGPKALNPPLRATGEVQRKKEAKGSDAVTLALEKSSVRGTAGAEELHDFSHPMMDVKYTALSYMRENGKEVSKRPTGPVGGSWGARAVKTAALCMQALQELSSPMGEQPL